MKYVIPLFLLCSCACPYDYTETVPHDTRALLQRAGWEVYVATHAGEIQFLPADVVNDRCHDDTRACTYHDDLCGCPRTLVREGQDTMDEAISLVHEAAHNAGCKGAGEEECADAVVERFYGDYWRH